MLGERLSALRKIRKLKQEDVARKIGVARTTYSMYEQDNREPDIKVLIKLADFYEVTIDYLVGREETVKSESADSHNPILLPLEGVGIDFLLLCDEIVLSKEEIALVISTIRSFRNLMEQNNK